MRDGLAELERFDALVELGETDQLDAFAELDSVGARVERGGIDRLDAHHHVSTQRPLIVRSLDEQGHGPALLATSNLAAS